MPGGAPRYPPQSASSAIHQRRVRTVTTEDLIIAHRDTPLGLSAGDVGHALFASTILVAAFDSHPPGPPGTNVFDGKTPMSFAGAADKHGRPWVYAYTSRPEFRQAFPQGRGSIEMRFADFFPLVVKQTTVAGILFNAGSTASYLMPRELFPLVQQAGGGRAGG